MGFMRDAYSKVYAANSRETICRQTIHQFEQARIVDRNPDDPSRPTNSGKNAYMLTEEAVEVLKAYDTPGFDQAVATFIGQFGTLKAAYERARATRQIPLRLPDGSTVYLSPGEHNALQVAIIEEFGPRFASGATVLGGIPVSEHLFARWTTTTARLTEDAEAMGNDLDPVLCTVGPATAHRGCGRASAKDFHEIRAVFTRGVA